MKKIPYVVSNLRKIDCADNAFFHSPCAASEYGLPVEGLNVASALDIEGERLNDLSILIEDKFWQYIEILGKRLNQIHGVERSRDFWGRAMSLGLARYTTVLHQFYLYASRDFDPAVHLCDALSVPSFFVCKDFEEARNGLSSWLGQEVLMSCFLRISNASFNEFAYTKEKIKESSSLLAHKTRPKLGHKISIAKRRLITKLKFVIYPKKNVRILTIGCLFSAKNFSKLKAASKGRIQSFEVSRLGPRQDDRLDERKREFLFSVTPEMDPFDKFFCLVSRFLFPSYLIEDFTALSDAYVHDLLAYPSLKYIVAEAWLDDSYVNLFRALAMELMDIKTIYPEHNCFAHPFVGSHVNLSAKLVDMYLTIGWLPDFKNFIQCGSMFEFRESHLWTRWAKKKYKCLFVSYSADQIRVYYSSFYYCSGKGAINHLTACKEFFESLTARTKSQMFYRGYPKDYPIGGLFYDKEEMLSEQLKGVRYVNSQKFGGESCKSQMLQSGLVVTDGLSTTYLEALMMDIPIVCFVPEESLDLTYESAGFFNRLIEAKVVFTNAKKAALHVEDIIESPRIWWDSPECSEPRRSWLDSNLKEPDLLIKALADLAK